MSPVLFYILLVCQECSALSTSYLDHFSVLSQGITMRDEVMSPSGIELASLLFAIKQWIPKAPCSVVMQLSACTGISLCLSVSPGRVRGKRYGCNDAHFACCVKSNKILFH